MKKGNYLRQMEAMINEFADQNEITAKNKPHKIYKTLKAISFQLLDTAISAYAGQAAFMLILSFFPFIMFLLALLRYMPLSPEILIAAVESFFPTSFRDFMTNIINEIYHTQSATLLPVTVVIALWLGSRSFLSIIYGLNSVYKIPETRGYITLRLWAVFYTLLFAILIIASLVLLVFGNQLFYHLTRRFPLITHILLPIISFRSAGSFLIMLFFFTGMYVLIPNHNFHKRPATFPLPDSASRGVSTGEPITVLSQLPGALLATAGWLSFSYLYSFYVDHISNYASFYGTMTMIALLMVWLYACMYILFFGGWLNDFLRRLTGSCQE